MAKHKNKYEYEPETPSNTTSGGEVPTPAGGVAKADGAEGTAVYPPSPSDQAGEKTDNVPPSKLLPPDVPDDEGGDGPPVPTAGAGIAAADAEVARLRYENAELRRLLKDKGIEVPGAKAKAAGAAGGTKYRVTMGSHQCEVTAADEEAAKAEFLRSQGIHTPGGPVTAVPADEAEAAEKGDDREEG